MLATYTKTLEEIDESSLSEFTLSSKMLQTLDLEDDFMDGWTDSPSKLDVSFQVKMVNDVPYILVDHVCYGTIDKIRSDVLDT